MKRRQRGQKEEILSKGLNPDLMLGESLGEREVWGRGREISTEVREIWQM